MRIKIKIIFSALLWLTTWSPLQCFITGKSKNKKPINRIVRDFITPVCNRQRVKRNTFFFRTVFVQNKNKKKTQKNQEYLFPIQLRLFVNRLLIVDFVILYFESQCNIDSLKKTE